jgi:UDP-galactopyranose mutase
VDRPFGYNAGVLYPLKGGIQMLPETMASRLGLDTKIQLGTRAVSIEAGHRVVRFDDGKEASYEWLVSTLPLNRVIAMIDDAPAEVRRAASSLKSVSVHGVNVGLKGAFDHDHHWTYFPGEDFVFYRTGYISNYSPAMAPEGCSSLTAEVARRPDEPLVEGLEGRVVDDLVRAGVVERAGDVVLVNSIHLDPAYVVFDRERQAALPVLFEYLMQNRIMPIGRYGAWNYLGMEDSILHGMQAAARLKAEGGTGG